MQQFCKYGSVRGAAGNRRPYRDPPLIHQTRHLAGDSSPFGLKLPVDAGVCNQIADCAVAVYAITR